MGPGRLHARDQLAVRALRQPREGDRILRPPPGHRIDVAAYTLGAKWIERHFTKDRTWKGTDHAASLEPAGLGKMCRDLVATHEALTLKSNDILEIETEQRNKLKYRKQ